MVEYSPSGPYFLQSGRRQGKAIEVLMFINYPWLVNLLDIIQGKNPRVKNRLHLQLEWLIPKGEDRTTKKSCSQCRKNPIVFFSALGNSRDGYSISHLFTCCRDENCKEKLIGYAGGKIPLLLPLRFSSLLQFPIRQDRDKAVRVLRYAFDLPKRLTPEAAFNFFASP